MKKEITLTMTLKQLESIIFTMGIALDTDCRPMNDLSEKKFEKISINIETMHEKMLSDRFHQVLLHCLHQKLFEFFKFNLA